jgi:hypothetical protein
MRSSLLVARLGCPGPSPGSSSPFCSQRSGRMGTRDGKILGGQQLPGDMARPTGPATLLIVVQPHLPLGCFQTLFDGSPAASHAHHLLQGRENWRKDHILGQLCRLAEAAAYQQPAAPARVDRSDQGLPPNRTAVAPRPLPQQSTAASRRATSWPRPGPPSPAGAWPRS